MYMAAVQCLSLTISMILVERQPLSALSLARLDASLNAGRRTNCLLQ